MWQFLQKRFIFFIDYLISISLCYCWYIIKFVHLEALANWMSQQGKNPTAFLGGVKFPNQLHFASVAVKALAYTIHCTCMWCFSEINIFSVDIMWLCELLRFTVPVGIKNQIRSKLKMFIEKMPTDIVKFKFIYFVSSNVT